MSKSEMKRLVEQVPELKALEQERDKLRKQVSESRLYAQKLDAACAVYREAFENIWEQLIADDNPFNFIKGEVAQALGTTDTGDKLLAVVRAAERVVDILTCDEGAPAELFYALKAYRGEE